MYFCVRYVLFPLQESIKAKGLRDDITVLVVDLLPSHLALADKSACPVPKGMSAAKSLMARFKVRATAGREIHGTVGRWLALSLL